MQNVAKVGDGVEEEKADLLRIVTPPIRKVTHTENRFRYISDKHINVNKATFLLVYNNICSLTLDRIAEGSRGLG